MSTTVFWSRNKSPKFLFRPATVKIVETTEGNVQERIPGKWIQFEKIPGGGFYCPLLPTRRGTGKAEGKLIVEHAARELGVEPVAIENFLRRHKSYGVEFVAEMLDENEESPLQAEQYLKRQDDGRWYCVLCDQYIKPQGLNGHKRKKEHLAALQGQREVGELEAVAS